MKIQEALEETGKARRAVWAEGVYVYFGEGGTLLMLTAQETVQSYSLDSIALGADDWGQYKSKRCTACRYSEGLNTLHDGLLRFLLKKHCECKEA